MLYGHNYSQTFTDLEELKNTLLYSGKFKGKYIFSHNAEFDLTVIFDNIRKNLDSGAVFNGSRLIFAQKEGVIFADSFNIFQTSVSALGKSLGFDKLETAETFINGTHKGKAYITQDEIKYCERDCEIVYKCLLDIFTTVQSIRPTIAGLSLLYFRRFYQTNDIAYNELTQGYFDAYFGGRVECFKIGKTSSRKYDVNSMYPYIMESICFPNPKDCKEVNDPTDKFFKHVLKNYEGFAHCEVIHKKTKYGYLPIKKDGKLIFPNGQFSGYWCFPEIRKALKDGVVTIVKVFKVNYSYRIESPFKEFAKDLYVKRTQVEGFQKTVYKSLLNNLYGKFAQREKFKEFYLPYVDFELDEILKEKGLPYQWKHFSKNREDCLLIVSTELNLQIKVNKKFDNYKFEFKNKFDSEKNKIHTIPLFSAYITSAARVYLLENILKYDKFTPTYCDTDSIAVEKLIPIQNSLVLGKFKKENEVIKEIFGNKAYVEFDTKNNTEKEKIKGIPKKAVKIKNKNYKFVKLIKTKQSIRQNLKSGEQITVEKNLKLIYDKRIVFTNGETEPITL